MRLRDRTTEQMVEPPAVLLTDIAFNLLIFFVVCASTEPSDGRKQDIPGANKQTANQPQQSENIEVVLTRATASVNGEQIKMADFLPRIRNLLRDKKKVEERVVLVRSAKDTPYEHWIRITTLIEQAGGITTLQMEEEQQVRVQ